MDWDNEFHNDYDVMAHDPHRNQPMAWEGPAGGFDPLDITNHADAYLYLSDDAQGEITGSGKKGCTLMNSSLFAISLSLT